MARLCAHENRCHRTPRKSVDSGQNGTGARRAVPQKSLKNDVQTITCGTTGATALSCLTRPFSSGRPSVSWWLAIHPRRGQKKPGCDACATPASRPHLGFDQCSVSNAFRAARAPEKLRRAIIPCGFPSPSMMQIAANQWPSRAPITATRSNSSPSSSSAS